ncbi:class A beta-lactamase-related serine hydrolase [Aquabacterium soli]|uniref:Class A beta-lactamase-related serine hydrolase n=1 Tax=Aquabacterium soli TaxID=2493092 RepID=A0A426VCE1_9BURK|nr:serine hydrolase domain-containing protein [Aquabacterium soli]RRS04522.1 class A beta-lactamase-related serine hydrolase [Aquabacterium soli]
MNRPADNDLLSGQRACGIAAGMSVWTPSGCTTRWTSPENGDQQPVFLIYSITKTFIACLLLQLAEAGQLDLDAPVKPLWQGPPLPGSFSDAVTTRRLLNHTAGLPDYGGLKAYHAQVREHPGQPWTAGEFIEATLIQPWSVPEPARFAYSNPGYMLLRHLLETVGGEPWTQQLTKRVCQPLGLIHTTVASDTADLLPLAPGLSRVIADGDGWLDVRGRYHPGWVSHGVIASTASDVTAFLHGLFSGRLLQPGSLAAMLDAVPVGAAGGRWRQPRYGLGLMVDPAMEPGPVRGHNGGGPGYSASAFGLWRAGVLQGIATSIVGGGEHAEAERLTFEALTRLA